MVLVINDCSHAASEVFEIPGMINLLAHGRDRDGLFQDGTEGGIARSDGVLEVADDEAIGGEESLQDGFHGCEVFSVVRSWETASCWFFFDNSQASNAFKN